MLSYAHHFAVFRGWALFIVSVTLGIVVLFFVHIGAVLLL